MTNMCSYILSCLLTAHHNEKCVQGGKRTTFRSIFGLWKITLSLFTTRKISWDFMAPAPNQFRLSKPKSTPRYKVGLTLLIPITTKSLFGRYKMGPKSPCEKKILHNGQTNQKGMTIPPWRDFFWLRVTLAFYGSWKILDVQLNSWQC